MRSFKRFQVLALSILVMLVLAACGSGGGAGTPPGEDPDPDPTPGPGPGGVTQFGSVSADEERSEDGTMQLSFEVTPFAGFFETSAEIPGSVLQNPFEGSGDTCVVSSSTDLDFGTDIPGLDEFDFTSVSAGETLTFNSGATVYATLERDELTLGGDTFIFYQLPGEQESIPGQLPQDLSVTIPGGDFPPFVSQDMPIAVTFELTAPANTDVIDATTQFAWVPSAAANSVVEISISNFDFTEFEFVFVDCVVEDDGAFQLADATFEGEGLDPGFSGQLNSAGRTAFRVAQSGNAALFLRTSSTQQFGVF